MAVLCNRQLHVAIVVMFCSEILLPSADLADCPPAPLSQQPQERLKTAVSNLRRSWFVQRNSTSLSILMHSLRHHLPRCWPRGVGQSSLTPPPSLSFPRLLRTPCSPSSTQARGQQLSHITHSVLVATRTLPHAAVPLVKMNFHIGLQLVTQ